MSKTVSRHELILPLIDDKFILFNGLYGAIDVVDARTADIIRDAQQGDGAPTELDEDVRERLIRRGHLVERQTEADDLKILSRLKLHCFDRRTVMLVITPSYNCNFRCTYCYQRYRLRRGQEWLERIMSLEQIDAVFDQMREYREQGRQLLSCTIHGGEPFLARNIKTIRRICEHCRELDLPISVFTNGYELDAYFDLIKEFNIDSLLITLDGVGAKHDRRRPVAGGGSSYERIVKNVTAALERGINIRLRTNVDRQNIDELGELLNDFKARGFIDHPNCDYYFKSVMPDTAAEPALELNDIDVFEKLRELGYSEREAINHESAYSVCGQDILHDLSPDRYLMLRAKNCGAAGNMAAVDASGKVFACWAVRSFDVLSIGKLDVERGRFNFNFDLVKWRTRRVQNIEECRECPYVMQCGGGCAAQAFNRNGSIMKPFCDTFKEIFNWLLPYACREAWAKDQTVEMSKSWREPLSKFDEEERRTLLKTTDPKQTLDIWSKAGDLSKMPVTLQEAWVD
ncbi:MAG: radical SAM protein [Selenomonadaceae bacterium]|nr:radical SAM protein [Selenomonadaceae bacterium]